MILSYRLDTTAPDILGMTWSLGWWIRLTFMSLIPHGLQPDSQTYMDGEGTLGLDIRKYPISNDIASECYFFRQRGCKRM